MDESILDADQVENLIKFCPTKEEMELLKASLHFLNHYATYDFHYLIHTHYFLFEEKDFFLLISVL